MIIINSHPQKIERIAAHPISRHYTLIATKVPTDIITLQWTTGRYLVLV